MLIYLIRHGKPEIARKGLYNARRAIAYASAYDEAGVEKFSLPGFDPLPFRTVFCSTLNRARQTARILFGDKALLVESEVFREFERKVPSVPFLFLPVGLWLLIARVLWMMGFNSRGIETYRQAQARARQAAALLEARAREEGQVALVAHGFLNRSILRYLKQSGWRLTRHGGHGYLGMHILEAS